MGPNNFAFKAEVDFDGTYLAAKLKLNTRRAARCCCGSRGEIVKLPKHMGPLDRMVSSPHGDCHEIGLEGIAFRVHSIVREKIIYTKISKYEGVQGAEKAATANAPPAVMHALLVVPRSLYAVAFAASLTQALAPFCCFS